MSENSKTVYFGTGHRKEAVARVRIVPGSGQSWINGTPGEAYLQFSPTYIRIYKSPLSTLGLDNKYDIYVKATGGGLTGQTEAIRLGLVS